MTAALPASSVRTPDAALSWRDCPACAGSQASPVPGYAPDPWILAACDDCGLVYLRNPPGYTALEEDLAWEKQHQTRREARRKTAPLSGLSRKIRTALNISSRTGRQSAYVRWFGDGKVLDIGCGDGGRIQPPMTPYGIELSKALYARADATMRAHGGYCLHAPGADGLAEFEPDFFDGVMMFSYLEHEEQVMKTLTGVHRVLKSGGRAFVRVPNYGSLNRRVMGARWCGFRWPDHVNYFTLSSLRDVAARAGLTTELVNRSTLPVDDNVQVLLAKN